MQLGGIVFACHAQGSEFSPPVKPSPRPTKALRGDQGLKMVTKVYSSVPSLSIRLEVLQKLGCTVRTPRRTPSKTRLI